ncbi:tight adherence protein B [Actinoplanes octamycinicus]|uniref:Tight adherence protein B n=1 Tax=Actinoplanes octamycinicus TaxID=135948 RepID=A0A7W7GUE9_9ACTN|nr:hypothetical protein [Actinoplanes octamycinicus]MBB4738490.1 tight adherence protein B [Actinoplanes octamycinicus]GIE57611.1 hypothetical protein Aoc01nite_30130 [Actinoplanes octamycinicus]
MIEMLVPALCLFGCATVVMWPRRGVLARLGGRRRRPAIHLGRRVRMPVVRGRRAVLGVAGTAAVVGLLLGGPVAALVGAVYGGLGVQEWDRRQVAKQVAVRRAASLDRMTALVADLRAGLPPASVAVRTGASGSVPTDGAAARPAADARLARLAGAVWQLAEQTGAPAADLLGRIEADARAADRASAAAGARAAGAQTTAVVLAVLPVAGVAVGYAMGIDPLRILLHTPFGAGCAAGALLLQCGGLWWTRRLMSRVR